MKPTYGQLVGLLTDLGFAIKDAGPMDQAAVHAPSDTLMVFARREPEAPVRPAELVAVQRTLVEKGLIDPASLAIRLARFVEQG